MTRAEAMLLQQPASNRGVQWGYDKDRAAVVLDFMHYDTMRAAEDYLETQPRLDVPVSRIEEGANQ